ncbi:MAG: pyrophosphatase PpaX [Firmicutes bacterium]|nr:pyrophosphatase PpaX [Bacillota bacterium]
MPRSPWAAVLFDLDGTLIDTNELILVSFDHVFREHLGLQVPRAQVVRHFGEPLSTILARFAPPERVPELIAAYRAFNLAHHDRLVRPIPGVRAALDRLRAAGVPLAVTTSKRRETAYRGLRLFGLEGYFQAVVTWEDATRHKPDPEPVLVTLDRLGVPPGDRVLMVGDSVSDLLAGRAAGVRTAAVAWSLVPRAELEACAPDFWLERPEDLIGLCLPPEPPGA